MWRSRWIDGIATLTIATSRIVMKNAAPTTARISHLWCPDSVTGWSLLARQLDAQRREPRHEGEEAGAEPDEQPPVRAVAHLDVHDPAPEDEQAHAGAGGGDDDRSEVDGLLERPAEDPRRRRAQARGDRERDDRDPDA